MEEIDKIIIDSLKHINCDIDDDIVNLKQFDPNLILTAISTCLEVINPDVKMPKTLPGSMSTRIKVASNVAHQIRDLGFKGDMGYQTILYSNEIEVRRVLMFLIELLPKEISSVTLIEPDGLASKVLKDVQSSLKHSLKCLWLPTVLLYNGTRKVGNNFVIHSLGGSSSIDVVNLSSVDAENSQYLPLITKQCSKFQLIPSLLFEPALFTNCKNWKQQIYQRPKKIVSDEILANVTKAKSMEEMEQDDSVGKTDNLIKNPIEPLLEKLKEKNSYFVNLENCIEDYQSRLEEIEKEYSEKQVALKQASSKLKILSTTLAVVNDKDNQIKLKNSIQKTEKRLLDLAEQWNAVRAPLLKEHRTLKSSITSDSLQFQSDRDKHKTLTQTHKSLLKDFKEKCALEQNLIKNFKELNNKNNRTAYTKRILEIVGNIKKQNVEIQKVLRDTKEVQKDINSLTGQVDRSFTLSDELIFYDCKHDEVARKAYKFLAALREECNGILQAVSNMGQAERELRNVEEQVETERNKEVKDKLDRVRKDLDAIIKEIKLLA